MRLLIIQRNAQIGGGNTYLRAVAPALRARGHDLRLMVGPGPLSGELRAEVGPLQWRPPVDGLARLLVNRAVRRLGIEAVNAHTYKAGRTALDACRCAGIPLIQHVHSLIPLQDAADVLAAAARIVVMNRAVRDWVCQVEGLAPKVIQSVLPVDPRRFHPLPRPEHDCFRVLYCGRLARRKAAYVLAILQELPALARAIPNIELAVVGGRSHRRHVAQAASEVNRALGREAVRMLGQLREPAGEIGAADLVIGTGYVALEALACGRHFIGVGIQGLTGFVTPDTYRASSDANFGDHAALERDVTPARLRDAILEAHATWQDRPLADWAPPIIAAEHSPSRVADDLEQALGLR